MVSALLCDRCSDLQLSQALDNLGDGDLQDLCTIPQSEFFKSALSCDICRLTKDALLEKASRQHDDLGDDNKASIIVSLRKDGNHRRLSFISNPGWTLISWMVWTTEDALVDANPSSAKSLRRMRDWIHECDQGHSQCKKPDSTFLPTRLLDVGVASSKQTRLVLSTDIEAVEASYVALSHCWGPSKPLVTTSSNISQFQVDIPASSLPQTFEDAIEVTRLLGKRHLWIDSLCIIQDVPADWLRESATMSSVYSNADITISASRASSAVDGFLSLRHEIYVTKQEPNRSGQETKLYLVLRDYYENSTSRAADSHPEPLSRRAWVIQERYLSRRKILFGSAQTFWECNGMAKSEDTQLEMRSNLAEPPRSLPWYDIVESFTDCAITYESDTLPAISGVAKTVAQTSGLTYCAGIWVNDSQLCNSLLWYPKRNGPYIFRKIKRKTHIAPSFSWAASQGPIWYRAASKGIMGGRLCKYVAHNQTLRVGSSDPYGAIEDAWVMLTAPLIEGVRLIKDDVSGVNLAVKLQNGTRYVVPATFDHEEVELPPNTFLLLLYSDESRMQALILTRISELKVGLAFRRIGICWVPFEQLRKLNWWGNISSTSHSEREEELQRFVRQGKAQMETVILA